MPFDTSVPIPTVNYDIGGVVPHSVLDSRVKAMNLRTAALQQQNEQQTLQQNALANKVAQQKFNDDLQYRQIMAQAAQEQMGAQAQGANPPQGGAQAPVPVQQQQGAPPQGPQAQQFSDAQGNPSVAAAAQAPPPQGPQAAPPQQNPQQGAPMAPSAGGMMGFDFPKTINRLRAAGNVAGAQALTEQYIKQSQDLSVANKNNAEAGHFQVQTQKLKTDAIADGMQAVLNLPKDQMEAGYYETARRLVAQGYMAPNEVEPFPGKTQLAQHYASLEQAQKQTDLLVKQQEEMRKADLFPIEKNKAIADASKAGSDATTAGITAAQTQKLGMPLKDYQQGQREDTRTNIAQSELGIARQNLALRAVEVDPTGQLGVNPKPMGASTAGLTGDAYLQTLPKQMQASVKAIDDGRESPSTLGRGGAYRTAVMAAVNQYDPQWNEQRAQLRRAFAVGPNADNIGNLSTAVVHLDQYHEAMKAQKNGPLQPGNQLWNYVASKFGSANATNPNFVRSALAGEAASALKGVATDKEIESVMKSLDPNQSPEQQEGASLEGLKVLKAKLDTYEQRYKKTIPSDDGWTPVLPQAQEVFNRYGFKGKKAATPAAAPTSVPANPFTQQTAPTSTNPFRK